MLYHANQNNNHLIYVLTVKQQHSQDLEKEQKEFLIYEKYFSFNKPVPPTAIAVAIARFSSK